ncbi:hypothetical protein V8B97DRAFT_160886 [Scleroderma yunnanense]
MSSLITPDTISSDNVHKLLSDTNLSASSFVQSVFTSVFHSSFEASAVSLEESQFVLDELFSPDCEVRRDHELQDLIELKEELIGRKAAARSSNVKFEQIISTNDDRPDEPAVVAGVIVVTRYMPFLIRASPAQRLTHLYFSAKLEPLYGELGGSNRRRFTSFYYTLVDKVPPIRFAMPHHPWEDEEDPEKVY